MPESLSQYRSTTSEKTKELWFLCTGLGRINRGFETYISSLGEKLAQESENQCSVRVFSGGRVRGAKFRSSRVFCISRKHKWLARITSPQKMFDLEQLTFFFFFLPRLLFAKPKAIYLGEYSLYCYLFKVRKWLGLKFSLVLYTGGQVSPGLFDSSKDFVHHVTDIYYEGLVQQGIPRERQFVIPHFMDERFVVDEKKVSSIRSAAAGKKIILSVGSIDSQVKRMNLIPEVLGPHASAVFPILLGEDTPETAEVRKSMLDKFGSGGFVMNRVPRKELGSYYTAADAFMLCSKKESFGLVFLEAMYFNLNVVCHDFYEARYVLKENAHYINMDDIISFRKQFELLLPQLQRNAKLNSFVMEEYTWSKLRERYLAMFSTILDG